MEGYVYLTEKDLLGIARYLKLTLGGVRDQVCVSNQAICCDCESLAGRNAIFWKPEAAGYIG